MSARGRARRCATAPPRPDRLRWVFAASFLERVVDDLLDRGDDMHPPGWRILHHHKEHVFSPVDHQIGAGGAVPFDLAERARRRRYCIAGIGTNPETVAEAKAVAGKIEIIARDPRSAA